MRKLFIVAAAILLKTLQCSIVDVFDTDQNWTNIVCGHENVLTSSIDQTKI